MTLLIDMGNTRLKWALMSADSFITGATLNNNELTRQSLLEVWQTIVAPQRLAIACVSANELLAQVQAVAVELWSDIEIIRVSSQPCAFGVSNAYAHAEQLGVDRWLALVAARQSYQTAVCVVDCGTAITIDLMDAQGVHQGGFISAGLTLMKQALAQGTAKLPFNQANYDDLKPANNTEAAMYKGTLLAAVGLIETVLKRQANTVQLILTGGDAQRIANQLTIPYRIDGDLVLRGLARVLST